MASAIYVEQELIWQVKRQDQAAFIELYDRTIADVARLVHYLLDDPTELEDVIQEVYIAVYRAMPKFDPGRPFGPWLMGIVIRQVNAHRRRFWRSSRLKRALNRGFGVEHEPDIADQVADTLQAQALVQAIPSLPPKLKSVVMLHYLHDYTRNEIAGILGTVASRLRLAMKMLRGKHEAQLSESGVQKNGL
jgi:RNA polymerase sigma-70 factor, ECF subfamily